MKDSGLPACLRLQSYRWPALLAVLLLLAGANRAVYAQSQVINMAVPAKSFQMVIYPIAQAKGYMKDEGLDERVIFVAPTTSIQAMLGGDVHFTGAGSSDRVMVSLSGHGAANLAQLKTRAAEIRVAGSGRVALSPREEATVSVTGAGLVTMASRPARLNQTTSGAGRVRIDADWRGWTNLRW